MNKYKLPLLLLNHAHAEGHMTEDPLDCNVDDVDTSFPLLAAGTYQFNILEATKASNKAQTGENIVVKLKLAGEAQSTKGETVKGIQLTDRISLEYTDKYTVNDLKRRVALLAKSAGLSCKVSDIVNNPAMLNGYVVTAKIGVKKETEEFPASNQIKQYEAAH